MPSFSYTAKAENGRRVQGKLEAESLAAAEKELNNSHQVVYKVEEESSASRNVKSCPLWHPFNLKI